MKITIIRIPCQQMQYPSQQKNNTDKIDLSISYVVFPLYKISSYHPALVLNKLKYVCGFHVLDTITTPKQIREMPKMR